MDSRSSNYPLYCCSQSYHTLDFQLLSMPQVLLVFKNSFMCVQLLFAQIWFFAWQSLLMISGTLKTDFDFLGTSQFSKDLPYLPCFPDKVDHLAWAIIHSPVKVLRLITSSVQPVQPSLSIVLCHLSQNYIAVNLYYHFTSKLCASFFLLGCCQE